MFQDDKFYCTDDPALLVIGSRQTLAHWRCQGRGPAYSKAGRRVLYAGSELNLWIAAQTVRPVKRPPPANEPST